MVEWKEAASTVYNIISFLFGDEVSSEKKTIVNGIRKKIHFRRIKKFCYAYFKANNGTVLTNPIFSKWLVNDKTIYRLFKYTAEAHTELTDEEYLNTEVDRIQKYMEYPVDGKDIDVVRGLLKGLLIRHRAYREKYLSEDTKQIIQNDDRNTKRILNEIDSLPKQLSQEVTDALKSVGSLSLIRENTIFKELNSLFWQGQFEILENIQPALHDKSKSIDLWLSFVLSEVLLNGTDYRPYQSINDIENPSIREDTVRKTLIFSYFCKKSIGLVDLGVSRELRELVSKLQTGDDWLFNETREIKDNVECYTLSPFRGITSESETIKRLQVINAFERGVLGVSSVIDAITKDNQSSDFLTDLIKQVRHYSEALFVCNDEESAKILSTAVWDELWNKKDLYIRTNSRIQVVFWNTLLKACEISAKGKIIELVSSIPQEIQVEMQDEILLARLNSGKKLDKNEIVDVWKSKKNKEKMCSILSMCDSEYASEIVNEIPDALYAPEVVIVYCECFIRDNKKDEAGKLLDKYSEVCEKYAEYWVDRVEVFRREDDVNKLAEGWNNHEFKYINIQTDEFIANILYKWKRYELCLLVIKSLELKGFRSVNLRKLKAFSMINTDRSVEGLAVLNELVPECNTDYSVIGNIMNYSLSLQREVSDDVVAAAEQMNSSDIKLFLAVIFERRGDILSAKRNYWKALILNTDSESKVYGAYWSFLTKYHKCEVKVEMSAEETCIVACEQNGNRQVIIGIISKSYITTETNVEGITLVPTDDAIKRGWFGKKVDATIDYKGSLFQIAEVKTIDAAFSEMCLKKMVRSGEVKVFSLPQNSSPDQMREHFVKFLKDNSLTNNNKDIFNDYKDLSKLPFSLFSMSQCMRTNYLVSVFNMLNDGTLLVREWIDYENNVVVSEKHDYVLSFSSLILLFLLQVPIEQLLNNGVHIPESTLIEIKKEKEEVIIDIARETGTISVIDDNLHFWTNSDESKQELMKFVTEFLEYAEKIPSINNQKDFSFADIPESQMRQLFGTPDLDAISICKTNQYTLISFELFLTDLNMLARNRSVTPLEFLESIEPEDTNLIVYLQRLLHLHMMNILDVKAYDRIVNSENERVLELWNSYLKQVDEQDGFYKNWIKEHFTHLNQSYQKMRRTEQPINVIEEAFAIEMMKLLEREIHYSMNTLHDAEGNIVIRTYMRVFDKSQQKYLEDLDQVIDNVFGIETSIPEEENQ